MDELTQAEKRCLVRSYEINTTMPHFPERIYASFTISRAATIESLARKKYLLWTPYRGSSYTFTEKAREFIRASSLTPQNRETDRR